MKDNNRRQKRSQLAQSTFPPRPRGPRRARPARGPAPYPGRERDVGDEAYRRDDRFFGARHGSSPPDADACADGARSGSSPLGRTRRAARAAPDACWAALWRLRARELLVALVSAWAAGD